MLVAATVAFAVAAVSVTCWFIMQGKLYDQLNNHLKKAVFMQKQPLERKITNACNNCTQTPQSAMTPSAR